MSMEISRATHCAKGSTKVIHLSKCDGTPSDVGIMLGGRDKGSIITRGDRTLNCCPILLRNIWLGDVESPSFPHSPHAPEFSFVAVEKAEPMQAGIPTEANQ